MKAADTLVLPLDGALVFFDVAGTLVEADARLNHRRQTILCQLRQRVKRLVLVTGQPFDDPQVQEILSVCRPDEPDNVVAYTTRGGLRLTWDNGAFRKDLTYLADTRLEAALCRMIKQEVAQVLEARHLHPLIPVRCIDEVAVRVNLPPAERPSFTAALSARFQAMKMAQLQVTAEGRTSVFVMRRGVGKRLAVQYELERVRQEGIAAAAFYFGDEIAMGNDREVLGLPGVAIYALGPCEPVPPGARCRTIGQRPDDLYHVLEASLATPPPAARCLPVVCLSLGGTKIEVGALTQGGRFLASDEIRWRESPEFNSLLEDVEAARFCDTLVQHVDAFLRQRRYTWSDVGVLGLAFPGPQDDARWHSNNLNRAFQGGVALEQEMSAALARLDAAVVPQVRVVFDAQCDAGGEVYHPEGRLRSAGTPNLPAAATVLNVASGIAAGFVCDGKVLVSDQDFRTHVHHRYDGGAGQLGRHLWYHPDERQWTYHFCPRGRTPDIEPPAIRMTERLSGPALAARLLLRLGGQRLLPQPDTWTLSQVTAADVSALYQVISKCDPERDLAVAARLVRGASRPVAAALLTWADAVYRRGEPLPVASCLRAFAMEVAADFAGALTAWMSAAGWERYGRYIILTGTVGIRFLASSDALAEQSFLCALTAGLPLGCRVERSRLLGASERECYLFLHQPAANEVASAAGVSYDRP
ncbi:MAG TPA: hypothetical protein VNP04_06655 [Alphaproteobacteria bacterium]|nr:hypothetical protein [Alphaproteobacteria bacterium]